MNSATIDPLGASMVAIREMIDVNLSFYLLLPSQRFSILILCRKTSRNNIRWDNQLYYCGYRHTIYRQSGRRGSFTASTQTGTGRTHTQKTICIIIYHKSWSHKYIYIIYYTLRTPS